MFVVPLGFETSGAWGDSTKDSVRILSVKLRENQCDKTSVEHFTQQISIE